MAKTLTAKLLFLAKATMFCLWSLTAESTSYGQPDLVGTWHLYSFWDGDANDPGWTRQTISVDPDGDITGLTLDSDGNAGDVSGTLTLSASGAVTYDGAWSAGYTSARFQMDSGKTVVAGVSAEVDAFGPARNFEISVKQGSGFTTADLAGTWDLYVFYDTQAVNDPGWLRIAVTFDGSGMISSGDFADSEGSSGALTGSANLNSVGLMTLEGAWAAGISSSELYLDADGTVLAGVYNALDDDQYVNLMVGVKRQGSYQSSDIAGDWDIFTFFDNIQANEGGTSRAPLLVSSSGSLTGLVTDFDQQTFPVSGTASVNASGSVTLGGAWVADFSNDRFSMDAGKTFFVGTAIVDGTGRDIVMAVDAPPFDKRLAFANPASNQSQQSFIRVVNKSDAAGEVVFSAIDDAGDQAPGGDLSFTLSSGESRNFNSLDYELGNQAKGLSGGFGDGAGKWQLLLASFLDLEAMSLIRTPDGFVTNLTDIAPETAPGVHEIYFANPGSNVSQQSFLRIVNKSDAAGTVTVTGVDDNGDVAPGGSLEFSLGPYESKNFNSRDYELGNQAKGLVGALGDGAGKWHLTVTSTLALEVMSLIRSSDGFLTDLSGQTPRDDKNTHRLFLMNPGENLDQQGFMRVVNTSDEAGTVTITGIDDNGATAPGGNVQFDLGPFESKNVNAQDLENGNFDKGLSGALGDGEGRWQLIVECPLNLRVMDLTRTSDGFVTNMSRLAPKFGLLRNEVYFVNPGKNLNQRSFLRLVNRSDQPAEVIIEGIDDQGKNAPGGSMTLSIAANAAKEISAAELESGNPGAGLAGGLGKGTGKWRLTVSADAEVATMSLLETSSGFLTNQSRVIP